jgi:hypothetical protein
MSDRNFDIHVLRDGPGEKAAGAYLDVVETALLGGRIAATSQVVNDLTTIGERAYNDLINAKGGERSEQGAANMLGRISALEALGLLEIKS